MNAEHSQVALISLINQDLAVALSLNMTPSSIYQDPCDEEAYPKWNENLPKNYSDHQKNILFAIQRCYETRRGVMRVELLQTFILKTHLKFLSLDGRWEKTIQVVALSLFVRECQAFVVTRTPQQVHTTISHTRNKIK